MKVFISCHAFDVADRKGFHGDLLEKFLQALRIPCCDGSLDNPKLTPEKWEKSCHKNDPVGIFLKLSPYRCYWQESEGEPQSWVSIHVSGLRQTNDVPLGHPDSKYHYGHENLYEIHARLRKFFQEYFPEAKVDVIFSEED